MTESVVSGRRDGGLFPSEKIRARKLFSIFSVFNTLSFLLLSGNIITLYLLRLGASSSLIGVVSSFTYISFFFMFAGRQIVEKIGVARLFAHCWTYRYLLSLPMVFSPVFIRRGMEGLGFGLIIFGALGFQVMRGVGLVSNSPIIGAISEGRDRGDFLSRIQIFTHAAAIMTGIMIAFLLSGAEAPILRYALFILAGILFGLTGSMLLFRLPKNIGAFRSDTTSFIVSARRAFSEKSFRRFIMVFSLTTFTAGMSRPFLIVYAAEIYTMSDSATMYLSVIGSLGALAMGFVAQLLLDRIGAKPILVFFSGIFLVSLFPLIVAPGLTGLHTFVFLGVLFFFFNFSSIGQENASQTYFYASIKPEDQLDFGLLYFLTFGVGGTLGSLAGGVLLDGLNSLGFTVFTSYRVFYGILSVFSLMVLISMHRLESYGAYSVRNALNLIFSARDLRAIILLNRLDRSTSIDAERRVIEELGSSPSEVTVEGLIHRLKSPSFTIRTEALRTLEGHPPDPRVIKALLWEVKNHEFTTAYRAARILGLKLSHSAVPVLRNAVYSEDYLLSAESMVALARLKDKQSIKNIEVLLKVTKNPLLITFGAEALRIFGDPNTVPSLLSILERKELPEDLRNQTVLALAGILNMEEWFYPLFTVFLREPADGVDLLLDVIRSRKPGKPFKYKTEAFRNAFAGINGDKGVFISFMGEVFKEASFAGSGAEFLRSTFYEALGRELLTDHANVRYLFAAVFTRFLPE
jgi:MFS family permease